LLKDHEKKQEAFRAMLAKHEQDVVLLKNENKQLKVQLDAERNKARNLEQRLGNAESANRSLTTKVNALNDMKLILENDLDEKELQINQEHLEKHKVAKKYRAKVDTERERLEGELNKKLELQRNKLRQKNAQNNAKMNAIKALINSEETDNDENIENGARGRANSNPDLSIVQQRGRPAFKPTRSDPRLSGVATPARNSVAVSNPRHRRSRSTDKDMWLDHSPAKGAVPLNTVLQPALKKRRSVTRLQEKDIVNNKTSKYLLTTQNQDEEGQLETRLYKADVLPTAGGGRQVVFNDVEVLTQTSPTTQEQSPKKRSYEVYEGIGARIAHLQERGVEGEATSPAHPDRITKRSKRL
jgi:kinesin family protein 23